MIEEKESFFSTERGKRFVKFVIVGLAGWGINELLIFLFLLMFDSIFSYDTLFTIGKIEVDKVLVSSLMSITIVTVLTFTSHKFWTFRGQEKDYKPKAIIQFLQFAVIGITSFAMYTGIIFGLHTKLGVNKYLATSIGFLTGLVNNFIWNDLWTFNPKFLEKRKMKRENKTIDQETKKS
jgi:putative flippase GtrA